MELSALTRNSRGEQDHVAMSAEVPNERISRLRGNVFRNLQALHEFEAVVEIEGLGDVDRPKMLLWNYERISRKRLPNPTLLISGLMD
ncbi:MAG: hypothetical protein ACREYC_28240 [Gammaproteobacteria bacterium]